MIAHAATCRRCDGAMRQPTLTGDWPTCWTCGWVNYAVARLAPPPLPNYLRANEQRLRYQGDQPALRDTLLVIVDVRKPSYSGTPRPRQVVRCPFCDGAMKLKDARSVLRRNSSQGVRMRRGFCRNGHAADIIMQNESYIGWL